MYSLFKGVVFTLFNERKPKLFWCNSLHYFVYSSFAFTLYLCVCVFKYAVYGPEKDIMKQYSVKDFYYFVVSCFRQAQKICAACRGNLLCAQKFAQVVFV